MLGFSQSSAGACGPEGKGAQQRSLTACRMGGFWSAQVDIDFLCYGRGSEETGLQGFVKWPDVWKQECWNSLLDYQSLWTRLECELVTGALSLSAS